MEKINVYPAKKFILIAQIAMNLVSAINALKAI